MMMYQKHSNSIKKLLSPGDVVYSVPGGQEMKVINIDDEGFETEEDYFRFDEVRKLYFLTKYGYKHRNNKKPG